MRSKLLLLFRGNKYFRGHKYFRNISHGIPDFFALVLTEQEYFVTPFLHLTCIQSTTSPNQELQSLLAKNCVSEFPTIGSSDK